MKKLHFIIIWMVALCSMSLTSCIDDPSSSAEINYIVATDTIMFSDEANAVLDKKVKACLSTLNINGTDPISDYMFRESAESNQSSQLYAIALCNEKATKRFDANVVRTVTLNVIKNELFRSFKSYFTDTVYVNKAEDIDLKSFTIKQTLWGSYGTYYELKSATIDVKN